MSATVKLSSKMPGDPAVNGIDHYADELIGDPEVIRVAVVYFDAAKVTHDTDSGQDVPTIRVRRIEPLGDITDVPQSVRDAVAAAEERRTGRKPIPFEIVDAGEYAQSDTLDGE